MNLEIIKKGKKMSNLSKKMNSSSNNGAGFIRKFANEESGSILIIFAIIAAVIVGIALMSVDGSKQLTAESRFKSAVDQALLSVASKSSQLSLAQMQSEAHGFYDINFPPNDLIKLSKITITYDAANKEWTGSAEATMKSTSQFGGGDKLLTHMAKVKWDETIVEAVFAVDMSASMCTKLDQTVRQAGTLKVIPDASCEKLNYVKDGLKFIIGGDKTGKTAWGGLPTVQSADGQAGYKIGIVPFTHKVKMPDLNNIPPIMSNSEVTNGDESYFTQFNAEPGAAETDLFPLPKVLPLVSLLNEGSRQTLLNKVDELKTNYDVPGWTRSNVGFLTSLLMLDPEYGNYFTGGTTANPFGDKRTEKVVFLLTDGANMGCCYSSHNVDGEEDYSAQYLYSYRTDNEHLAGVIGNKEDGLCGQAAKAGVSVYTIVYDVQDKDAGGSGTVIKNVMKECATGPEGVNFYDLKLAEGDKIKDAYSEIAKSLMRLRLVY